MEKNWAGEENKTHMWPVVDTEINKWRGTRRDDNQQLGWGDERGKDLTQKALGQGGERLSLEFIMGLWPVTPWGD